MAEILLAEQEMEAGSDGPLPESVLMYKSTQGTRLSLLQRLGMQRQKPTRVCWSARMQMAVGTRPRRGMFPGLQPPPTRAAVRTESKFCVIVLRFGFRL